MWAIPFDNDIDIQLSKPLFSNNSVNSCSRLNSTIDSGRYLYALSSFDIT